jgi:A/G-specific adenine glycosylase
MTEVPTTEWSTDFDEDYVLKSAPVFSVLADRELAWRRIPGLVRHVFTHFPLELSVYATEVAVDAPAPDGARWVKLAELNGEALPSLIRKVLVHAFDQEPARGVGPGPKRGPGGKLRDGR